LPPPPPDNGGEEELAVFVGCGCAGDVDDGCDWAGCAPYIAAGCDAGPGCGTVFFGVATVIIRGVVPDDRLGPGVVLGAGVAGCVRPDPVPAGCE